MSVASPTLQTGIPRSPGLMLTSELKDVARAELVIDAVTAIGPMLTALELPDALAWPRNVP